MPYISYFPNSTRSKMAAWAGNQQPNGMLAEQIHNADPDTPEGRIMADSSSMFIMYVLELWDGDADDTTLNLYYPTVKRAAMWHMSTTKDYDLPMGLETTYDILGFRTCIAFFFNFCSVISHIFFQFAAKYEISAYASVFHMMAMKAAAKLAQAVGDKSFAAECESSLKRAQSAFDTLSWVGNYYSAASSNCTKGVGCTLQEGLFADAFYAQVLAYSFGLGDLLADPAKLKTHLETTAKINCAYPTSNGTLAQGCPNGLITLVGSRSPPGGTDHQIWQMVNHDWAALRLRNGGAEDISGTLEFSKRSVQGWSTRVKDQWNTAGISDTSSYPTVTSHYGYHMTSWHIPLALSKQFASLPTGELTFDPYLQPPYRLPFYFAGKLGSIAFDGKEYSVTLVVGKALHLKRLSIGGSVAPSNTKGGYVVISEGQTVKWR